MTKKQLEISIRFFNDREVRAIWDDERSKWWFSVLDVVGILNEESDYTKTRNYWKYLKAKLKKENNQLVSATTQSWLKNVLNKNRAIPLHDRLSNLVAMVQEQELQLDLVKIKTRVIFLVVSKQSIH